MLCKVGVRPALMVRPASASAQVLAFAENTAQPHPHPAVLSPERGLVAMFEILKPAPQRFVHVRDDYRQRVSISPPRLAADSVTQLLDALRSRPGQLQPLSGP